MNSLLEERLVQSRHPEQLSLSVAGVLPTSAHALCKTSLNIWKFMVHVLLKPGLEHIEHYSASV